MGFNRRFVSRVGSDEAIGPGIHSNNQLTARGIFIIVYVLHCTLVQVELHKTIPKRIKYYLYIVEKKLTQLGIYVCLTLMNPISKEKGRSHCKIVVHTFQ